MIDHIRSLIASGKLAEAQTLCNASSLDSLPQRSALLLEIERLGRERQHLAVPQAYHQWYYDSVVWQNLRWLGVPVFKSPADLWNYQEIIFELKPSLVIEFGTHVGGSALFFRSVLDMAGSDAEIITVDIDDVVFPNIKSMKGIRFIHDSSASAAVHTVLAEAIAQRPGRIFAILDSDHRANHVYAELLSLRDLLKPGDYVIVEDSNINGHPVLPNWGPGPFEAIERYMGEFPNDYRHDTARELKFGFTFAPGGFLIRQDA